MWELPQPFGGHTFHTRGTKLNESTENGDENIIIIMMMKMRGAHTTLGGTVSTRIARLMWANEEKIRSENLNQVIKILWW